MTDYTFPNDGPAFPRLRWKQMPDGQYEVAWRVTLVAVAPPLPLAWAHRAGVEILLSRLGPAELEVTLRTHMKPTRPEVYSVFYQLVRPLFEQGLVAGIEGGSLDTHRYVIEGTLSSP